MTATETKNAATFRLQEKTTHEKLDCDWSKTITFGDRVFLAGYYYGGKGKPSYFGAVYKFTKDERKGKTVQTFHCDDEIRLIAVSGLDFTDDGHAMQWCMSQTRE